MLRCLLRLSSKLFGHIVFTMRTGLARGMRRRYGFGFKPRFSLSREEQFLQSLDLQGKTVYDIGGYVGLVALFFSRAVGRSGRVLTFEPNPRNYEELGRNLMLNNCANVTTFPVAVGDRDERTEMVTDPIWPTRGSIETARKEALSRRGGAESLAIEVVQLDRFIEQRKLPKPDFIKIDVEGFERQALEGMAGTLKKWKPALLVEMHGVAPNEVATFLLSNGYALRHIESDTDITSPDSPALQSGHLDCR